MAHSFGLLGFQAILPLGERHITSVCDSMQLRWSTIYLSEEDAPGHTFSSYRRNQTPMLEPATLEDYLDLQSA